MRNVAMLAFIVSFSGIMFAASVAPANAFQFPEPQTNAEALGGNAVSAYAEDGQGAAAGNSSVLSPGEIHHIAWCAARYRLAYDAVNDVHIGKGGVQSKCISPE
jgi:hypothetical protein